MEDKIKGVAVTTPFLERISDKTVANNYGVCRINHAFIACFILFPFFLNPESNGSTLRFKIYQLARWLLKKQGSGENSFPVFSLQGVGSFGQQPAGGERIICYSHGVLNCFAQHTLTKPIYQCYNVFTCRHILHLQMNGISLHRVRIDSNSTTGIQGTPLPQRYRLPHLICLSPSGDSMWCR